MPTEDERSGVGVLFFPCEEKWFQGYFIDNTSKEQLGFFATERVLDECVRCPLGGYREYDVQLLHFENETECSLEITKTGGHMCTITGDGLSFETSQLQADEAAVAATKRYFPAIQQRYEGQEVYAAASLFHVLGRMMDNALGLWIIGTGWMHRMHRARDTF